MSQAIKVGELTFSALLDNHEPARSMARGTAERWRMADGAQALRIPNAEETFQGAREALYLVDNGKSVTPYYAGSWNDTKRPGEVFLYPLPTDRPGANGQMITFGAWMLGPKRAYHLKVTDGGE